MQQDFNQKRKHPGQTGLFMGSWPVMKDLTGFFLLISSSRNGPNRRLNNNRKTSALMPETKTLTEDPTIQRDPPPPPLIWAEGNHILVPESHQTILLHPIIPHVSIVSFSFLVWKPWLWWPLPWSHDYISIFFLPSTEVSKFFLISRYSGL